MSRRLQPAIDPTGFESLVEMIGPDMPEMVAEILDTYLTEAEELLLQIRQAQANGDLDSMLRPVHSLKSSSASVGALALSSTCAELETYLRGHGPAVDVDGHVEQINRQFNEAKSELMELRQIYVSD